LEASKIIIAVAPVAHIGTALPAGARNPLSPEEVAGEVVRCARVGASMVHLHVRNERGEPTFDLSVYSRTLDLIRRESDIVIQGSTGGLSTLTLEQRCVSVAEPRTQVASLNMGSVNFGEGVYINMVPDIRYWAGRMKEHGVVPELEIFEAGMLATVARLAGEGALSPPFNYSFSLGFRGALPADPRHLAHLAALLPPGSHWGLIHEGMEDYRLLAFALGLGAAAVRVGYEDGRHLAPGRVAADNVELVARLAELVTLLGLEIATPAETRALLGVRKD
jgi:3-keto-5-aminohexanoate cleavage enzyme